MSASKLRASKICAITSVSRNSHCAGIGASRLSEIVDMLDGKRAVPKRTPFAGRTTPKARRYVVSDACLHF